MSEELSPKEKVKAYQKKWYQENKERYLAKRKERYEKNKEKERAYSKKYQEANRERTSAHKKKWRDNNPENHKAGNKIWEKNNPKAVSARGAKYRASKLQRTPSWLTGGHFEEINKVYETCPEGWHVDHIIPLQGDCVSGLHVPWNLQHLPAYSNRSKGNRLHGRTK